MLEDKHRIEAKQQRRWHDLIKPRLTPLLDDALSLGPNDIPDKKAWKRLLLVAAFLDYHLQRSGAKQDLPGTHTAYLAAYHELRKKYLGR